MTLLTDSDRLPAGTTVGTIGMFDGLHLGHLTLLNELRRQATLLGLRTLVVTFDRHPRSVVLPQQAPKLLQSRQQRLDALRHLDTIDYLLVLPFTADLAAVTADGIIGLLATRYGLAALMMGYNHRLGHDHATFDCLCAARPHNIRLLKAPEYLGPYAPVSSTIVRSLIAAGRVADAMHSMQRPYCLQGTVVAGFHNGRGIGFPTANIGSIPPEQILPHSGAYAVMVHLPDQPPLQGMVNIGTRPTLNNGTNLSIEVNIFDFNNDIYGQPICLQFIGFLRLEFKMGSITELREQLTRDRERAKQILQTYLSNQPIS